MTDSPDDSERSSRFKPDMSRFLDGTADGYILLGVLSTTDAQRISGHMADRGVSLELIYNPATCSGGSCATTSELWAHNEDMDVVKEFLQKDRERVYGDLNFDPNIVSQVFDSEKGEATCPACAHIFSTTLSECPECGLGFGV